MPETPLRKRYLFKLGANIIASMASMLVVAIVPKSLGPVAYGNFVFLTNFFQRTLGFLDAGTSTAFYTKLSQNIQRRHLIGYYAYFMLVVFACLLSFLIVSIGIGFGKRLWPEQSTAHIFLAFIFSFLVWLMQVLIKISDAYALTTLVEKFKILQKVLLAMALVVFYKWGVLSYGTFFGLNITAVSFFIFSMLAIYFAKSILNIKVFSPFEIPFRGYTKELTKFAGPLVILVILSSGVTLLELWIFQNFAGSREVGFYGVAYQICTISITFTSAMVPLMTREIARFHEDKDIAQMSKLVSHTFPMFYFLAAFVAVFVSTHAEEIILLFIGEQYMSATTVLAVMSFYPLHQTYGQLSSSLFVATDRTRLYSMIGIITLFFQLGLTVFLVAEGIPFFGMEIGLGLKATGYGIKMISVQFLSVNVMLYFGLRMIPRTWPKLVAHQLVAASVVYFISCLSKYLLFSLLPNLALTSRFFLSGLIYCLFTFGIVLAFPGLAGLRHSDMLQFAYSAKNKMRRLLRKFLGVN